MRSILRAFTILYLLFALADVANAYIGPGAGIAAVATVIALIGAVLFSLFGYVWYPIKRFRARLQRRNQPEARAAPNETETTDQDKEDAEAVQSS